MRYRGGESNVLEKVHFLYVPGDKMPRGYGGGGGLNVSIRQHFMIIVQDTLNDLCLFLCSLGERRSGVVDFIFLDYSISSRLPRIDPVFLFFHSKNTTIIWEYNM